MIPYDAIYVKPTTVEEAIHLFQKFTQEGKNPLYFSGGTEIITLGRTSRLTTGAMIDIKSITECQEITIEEKEVRIGTAISLTDIIEKNVFPLLTDTAAQIADQTARNKITVGGNICGNILYKEAVLPFLLINCEVMIAGKAGFKWYPIQDVFKEHLQLADGDLLVQFKVNKKDLQLPYVAMKKRRKWGVGYPLITAAAVKEEGQLRFAFSGLCKFPFQSENINALLNDNQLFGKERLQAIVEALPAPILDDVHGSSEYRQFVLGNLLEEMINAFKGAGNV